MLVKSTPVLTDFEERWWHEGGLRRVGELDPHHGRWDSDQLPTRLSSEKIVVSFLIWYGQSLMTSRVMQTSNALTFLWIR